MQGFLIEVLKREAPTLFLEKILEISEILKLKDLKSNEDISEELYLKFHKTYKLKLMEDIESNVYVVSSGGIAGFLQNMEYWGHSNYKVCSKCCNLHYPTIRECLEIEKTCNHFDEYSKYKIPRLFRIYSVTNLISTLMLQHERYKKEVKEKATEEEKRRHDDLVRAEKSNKIKEEHISRLIATLEMRYIPDDGKLSPCFDPIVQREIAMSSGTMFAEIMAEATKRTRSESAKLLEAHKAEEARKKREEEAHKAELLAQETQRRQLLEEVAEIERLREAVRQVQEENKRLREQADLLIASCAELPIARVVHNTEGLTTNYPMISDTTNYPMISDESNYPMISDESEDPC